MKAVSRLVFVPAAISSFFEICDTSPEGTPIEDVNRIGARGGGFMIRAGNYAQAEIRSAAGSDDVYINGRLDAAPTSSRVIQLMKKRFNLHGRITLHHRILAPMGAGFGTSGAGAVGSAIAIADAAKLHLTLDTVGRIAHAADIQALTGLGTVTPLVESHGAVGLVVEPGAPGIGKTEAVLDDYEQYRVVAICFGPIEKATVIRSPEHRRLVNEWGRRTLNRILDDPSLESLLKHSRVFAEKIGLQNRELLDIADFLVSQGALGATQNMVGRAVHALTVREDAAVLRRRLRERFPAARILETRLDGAGARILGGARARWWSQSAPS